MSITEKQTELLQHMLGADSRYLKKHWGFRNHFCTSINSVDYLPLKDLEDKRMVKSGTRFDYEAFWATEKGAKAIGFKPYQLRKTKLAIQETANESN